MDTNYETFRDLLKIAEEIMDITECSLYPDGSIYIKGNTGDTAAYIRKGNV